jgi:serine/threonine protein kinase
VALSAHDRVGRYRVLSMVGTGRNCHVWDAIDDHSGEHRAIKILKDEFAENRAHIGFLKHEFAVARGLDHPQIIHIYECNVKKGSVYLLMELFPAENVKQTFLQVGPEGMAPWIATIAEQSVTALGFLHEQGWIHRDVKPDNFLMNKRGEVKLIDFALAGRRQGLLGRLIPSKLRIQGTRSYMAPEQIRGRGVDERSDIYGLACTLHELIAGKPPFTGANTQELLTKHLRIPPPPLEAAGRDVTPEFAELIRKMLSKKPANRPQSMNEVLRKLRSMQVFNRIPQPPVMQKSK